MALEDSEFGGHSGLIQPPPHEVVGYEAAFLERALDPADETRSVADVLADVLAGKYPVRPLPEAAEILPLQPDVLRAGEVAQDNGFQFVGVGNKDLRTARLKVSSNRRMRDAVYGPEKEVPPSVAPIVQLDVAVAPGNWFYQVMMNGVQVTQVWEYTVV